MVQTILFSGHLIDRPDEEIPRFSPEKEGAVRGAIRVQLEKKQQVADSALQGIAGGGCGGDILFHEVCRDLDIHTAMYLALPVEEFMKESVSYAGADWEARFKSLIQHIPVQILPDSIESGQGKNVWERTNLWMLNESIQEGLMILALWNGEAGKGKGGTEHLVKEAEKAGAETVIINPNNL